MTTIFFIKIGSFKSSENIQKKEGGPDRTVSNNQFSTVTLNEPAMNARDRAYYNSNRKAMNRNWSNQKANPALKTNISNFRLRVKIAYLAVLTSTHDPCFEQK